MHKDLYATDSKGPLYGIFQVYTRLNCDDSDCAGRYRIPYRVQTSYPISNIDIVPNSFCKYFWLIKYFTSTLA